MRGNANLVIGGDAVVLVPYREEHVEQYHTWMEDADLREATASERLTLEEEYEMQRSWCEDDDKCTFIILDQSAPRTAGSRGKMIGDVNLFFNNPDDPKAAEVEVMVAEHSSRRKGCATEAVLILLHYAIKELGVKRFIAKIGEANARSLSLFDKLGFRDVKYSKVFQEVEKAMVVDDNTARRIKAQLPALSFGTYD